MATHDVDETVLTLIGSGQADTRPAIVKQTGLAPSTVSAAVSRLVEAGVIAEAEHSVSTGGRRARRLVTSDGAGALALVELGAHHGLVALTDATRGVGQASSLLIDIAEGPQVVLDAVMEEVYRQEEAAGVRVGGIALAVPGPVDAERSRVIRPARMPGWDGYQRRRGRDRAVWTARPHRKRRARGSHRRIRVPASSSGCDTHRYAHLRQGWFRHRRCLPR